MTRREIVRFQLKRRQATLALLLAIAPAATLALPTDNGDLDVPRREDAPAASSTWDSAAPAPVTIVRPPGPPSPPPPPERVLSLNPLWEIPLSSLSATRERPIFSPSRRPPPPVVTAAPRPIAPQPPKVPRVERPQLSLVGTVGGDEESFGIFVDQTSRIALRLKIGEDYQGWKLRAVRGREVTLERDRQVAVLSLPQPGTMAPPQIPSQDENSTLPPVSALPSGFAIPGATDQAAPLREPRR